MISKDCSSIGYFSKTHGIEGDLILRLNGNFADLIEPGEPLFIDIDGTMVPFFILEVTPMENRAVVRLEFIQNEKEASRYISSQVYADIAVEDDFDPGKAQLYVSYTLVDLVTGSEGIITDFTGNTMNPYFTVIFGNKENMIPLSQEYIKKIDHVHKKISMKLPDGLLEL